MTGLATALAVLNILYVVSTASVGAQDVNPNNTGGTPHRLVVGLHGNAAGSCGAEYFNAWNRTFSE